MYLEYLNLTNYRNYKEEELYLGPNVNLFLGKNAQGKTNLLESIYYLSCGSSFRTNKTEEMIHQDCDYFRLKANLKKNRDFQMEVYFDKEKKKQIKINGVKYKKNTDLLGCLQTVLFSPDDLKIVKESPAERRRYIDLAISQGSKNYGVLLSKYQHILIQRNNLLKDIRKKYAKKEEIAPWNEQLAFYGSEIIKYRINFLKYLVPAARKIHDCLSNNSEKLNITYQSSLGNLANLNKDEIYQIFKKVLEDRIEEEIEKGISLFGPHRDDLIFYLNQSSLKNYGSQGQQRSVILSLKIAEIDTMKERNGFYPLLLLDDVMSELDDYRREYLLDIIKNKKIQTIITGANEELMKKDLTNNKVFIIEEGKIIKK